MKESDLMRQIMLETSAAGHLVFRANVGLFYTADRRPVPSGLPNGFSDLFGSRRGDAKSFYIEVKTATGRVSPAQTAFIEAMKKRGCIAGVARSIEDALLILEG